MSNKYPQLHHIPVSQYTGVPGVETEAEAKMMVYLAKQAAYSNKGKLTYAEIGGEYGRSASQMVFAALGVEYKKPTGRVVTFDLFPNDHIHVGNLLECWEYHLEPWKDRGLSVEAVQVDSLKLNAGDYFKPGELDLALIDGNHELGYVLNDAHTLGEYIKPGGYLMFHDYGSRVVDNPIHFEVTTAVEAFCSGDLGQLFTFHRLIDSLLVLRRREE